MNTNVQNFHIGTVGATPYQQGSKHAQLLYYDHVVGEGIRVANRCGAVLSAPTLETQVEDVDVERNEDDHIDEVEGSKAECSMFCPDAFL